MSNYVEIITVTYLSQKDIYSYVDIITTVCFWRKYVAILRAHCDPNGTGWVAIITVTYFWRKYADILRARFDRNVSSYVDIITTMYLWRK